MKRFVVGHVSGAGARFRFDTEKQASEYIGTVIEAVDPAGVFAGDYYIDDLQHPDAPDTKQR